MRQWLSLTVSEPKTQKKSSVSRPFFISVPKKVVAKAVRRNRLRRVLREALRRRVFPAGRLHVFRVTRAPETVNLQTATEALNELL